MLPLTYTKPYTGNTSYSANTAGNAYTCNISYTPYTNPYYQTYTGDIQLQTSNAISPGTYYITGAANNAWNGNYTISQDIGGSYTVPTVYWETTFPTQDGYPIGGGLDSSTPEATTLAPANEDWLYALFNQCVECFGTGKILSNTVEPTCSGCNGTGKGIRKLPSNG